MKLTLNIVFSTWGLKWCSSSLLCSLILFRSSIYHTFVIFKKSWLFWTLSCLWKYIYLCYNENVELVWSPQQTSQEIYARHLRDSYRRSKWVIPNQAIESNYLESGCQRRSPNETLRIKTEIVYNQIVQYLKDRKGGEDLSCCAGNIQKRVKRK